MHITNKATALQHKAYCPYLTALTQRENRTRSVITVSQLFYKSSCPLLSLWAHAKQLQGHMQMTVANRR